jgi:hypothetical protein
VLRDPRSFRNAVFLGLSLALGALGVTELNRLAAAHSRPAQLFAVALILLVVRDSPRTWIGKGYDRITPPGRTRPGSAARRSIKVKGCLGRAWRPLWVVRERQ